MLVIDDGRIRHESVVRRDRPRVPADLADLRSELLGVLGVHEGRSDPTTRPHLEPVPPAHVQGESLVTRTTPFRRLPLAAVLVSAALALAACGSGGNAAAVRDDGSVDLSKVTLVVGDQKGGSQALLSAAGDLDDLPYKVDWKPFTSGPPMLDAISSGAVDVGGVGNTPPLFAIDQGKKLKVVSAYSQGATGDAIVVPKGSSITDVAELKGKKVAVAKGSSANYSLLAQLDEAGLGFATSPRSTCSPPRRWPRSRAGRSTRGPSGTRSPPRPRSTPARR